MVAHERLRHVIATFAIVAIGIATATALGGHWPATLVLLGFGAPVLWLCDGWALPRTTDAHYRRVRRAWRTWELATGASQRHYASRRLDALHRAQALAPPPGHEALHMRLLELLAAPHGAASPREPLAVTDALDALPDDAYAAAWRELRADERADRTHAVDREAAATAALVARLENMRAPRAVAAGHARLVAAFGDYDAACRELTAAWARRDAQAVDAARSRVDGAEHEIKAAHDAIAGRVGRHGRWDLSAPTYHRAPPPL